MALGHQGFLRPLGFQGGEALFQKGAGLGRWVTVEPLGQQQKGLGQGLAGRLGFSRPQPAGHERLLGGVAFAEPHQEGQVVGQQVGVLVMFPEGLQQFWAGLPLHPLQQQAEPEGVVAYPWGLMRK